MEVYERIHLHLGYVCVSKSTMPFAIWFITIIPNPWKSIIIYFYGFHHKFPMFQILFDSIFLVIDWLTKVAHFIPTIKTMASEGAKKKFFNNIYKYHGFPLDIVSYCGFQFISTFWKRLFKFLKIQFFFSLANHPHTNGQTERWIKYWNNTFDVQSITIKMNRSTFYPWSNSHITSFTS